MSDEPTIDVHPFTPQSAVNYDGHIAALIAAGEGNAVTITFPTPDLAKHKRYFQEAAKRAERSAKAQQTIDNGDGFSSIEFTIGPLRTRTVKPKNTAPAVEAA